MMPIKLEAQQDLERRLDHYIGVSRRCKDVDNVVDHAMRAYCQIYEIMKAKGYTTRDAHDTCYEQYIEVIKQAKGVKNESNNTL